jgi:predicted DNA-binding transcriptional regulator AlpA
MAHCAMKEQPMTEPTIFLNEDAIAEFLNVSVRTIQRWRSTGDGPPFVRAGARRVIYSRTAIEQWAVSRTFAHHAAEIARAPPETQLATASTSNLTRRPRTAAKTKQRTVGGGDLPPNDDSSRQV